MRNSERSKRAMIGMAVVGAILVLSSLNGPCPASAEAQATSSAQLEAELSSITAKRDAAKADLAQIQAVIAVAAGIDKIPAARLKREAEDQAKRAYLKYVHGLDPDLAGFAVVVPLGDIIKELVKKKAEIEKKISTLNAEIAQLPAKIQQAKVEELSQQVQQSQPGGGSGGTKSQSGPTQSTSYTNPPQPPSGGAGSPPPTLPPGAYVTGFQVSCPGEAVAGETVTCTAIGVYSHDPYTTVDLTESTTWRISGATEWQKKSAFRTKDAAVVIVTATRGNNNVTRTVIVKAGKHTEKGSGKGDTPKGGGGGCGPGTSCNCGGAPGHISCDTGKCHCGGD